MNSFRSRHKLLLVCAIGLMGGVVAFGLPSTSNALLAATTTAPGAVGQSQEVVDEEFRRIVRNFNRAQPLTSTSKTGVSVAGRSALSAGASKLLKGGGGIAAVGTFLYFADSTDAGKGEITMPGAAKLELQTPRKSDSRWSTRHSHNKNDLQIYVRVNMITGTKANPKVTRGLQGTSSGLPGYVTLSSTKRGNDNGCGRTGNGSNRWKDSSSQTNPAGWAYFPDCSRSTTYQVKVVDLPKEYKNAKVYSSTRTVADKSGKIVIEEHEVNVYKLDLMDIDPGSQQQTRQCRRSKVDEVVNNIPPDKDGGRESQQGGSFVISNIFANRPNAEEKCDNEETKTYVVKVRGERYVGGNNPGNPEKVKSSAFGRTVAQLRFSQGKCRSKNPVKLGSDATAVFSRCPGNPTLVLSDMPKNYRVIQRVKDAQGDAVRISNNANKAIELEVVFENKLPKYSRSEMQLFRAAAHYYWSNEHIRGVPKEHQSDDNFSTQLNGQRTSLVDYREVRKSSAGCRPGNISVKYEQDDVRGTYKSANGGYNDYYKRAHVLMTQLSQAKNMSPSECQYVVNTHSYAMSTNADIPTACVIFVHEYGHLLGYGDMPAAYRNEVMFNKPRPSAEILKKTGCGMKSAAAVKALPAAAIPLISTNEAKGKCGETKLRRTFMAKGLNYRDKPEEEDLLEACIQGYRYGDYRSKEVIRQRKPYSKVAITVSADNPKSCMVIDGKAYPKKQRACKRAEVAARADTLSSKSYVYPREFRFGTAISAAKAKDQCREFIGSQYRSRDKQVDKDRLLSACHWGFRDGHSDTKKVVETGNKNEYRTAQYCQKKYVDNLVKENKKPAARQKAACDAGYLRAESLVESGKL